MNGENGTIKIYIVAASAVARAGLESVLRNDANIIVTGSAAEISAAPSVFSGSPAAIDVLLTNIERRKDFLALSEFLSDGGSDEAGTEAQFPVVALLAPDFQDFEQTVQLLRGGVRGILPSDATGDEINAAIIAAANNLIAAAPEMLDALFLSNGSEDFRLSEESDLQDGTAVETLTAREREVLELLVEGASNKVIADRMSISEHTVKFHVASIFGKLAVNSRTEAVTQALRRGLVLL